MILRFSLFIMPIKSFLTMSSW